MQSLAAYSFEAIVEDPIERLKALDHLIDHWLKKKGADNANATDGSFQSKTGDGTGQFSRRLINSEIGSLCEVELIETAHTGAMFTTRVLIARVDSRIVVFATLSATPGESRVAPVGLYPRCPGVIRSMIERFSDWKFAGQDVPLSRAFDATNPDNAETLCQILLSEERRFPIVVVSVDADEAVRPNLPEKIAKHVVGLADTAFVSAESSWVLTDILGPRDSCYLGAVRLYWPGLRQDKSFAGVRWLASRLATFGNDDSGLNRFLATLRREVMSVAALTMIPPPLYGEIRNTAERERLLALEKDARDQELDSIIEENARLSAELELAIQKIQTLQWRIVQAKGLERGDTSATEDDTETVEESMHSPPKPGECRFYKKIGSGGGVDTLVQTKSCNHKLSNWKHAFKGDKAEKGILKLEGRDDWKSIAHCSACTGGGRWRVSW